MSEEGAIFKCLVVRTAAIGVRLIGNNDSIGRLSADYSSVTSVSCFNER